MRKPAQRDPGGQLVPVLLFPEEELEAQGAEVIGTRLVQQLAAQPGQVLRCCQCSEVFMCAHGKVLQVSFGKTDLMIYGGDITASP